jgi:hypothetical protein
MYSIYVISGISSSSPAFSFSGDKRPARDVTDKKPSAEASASIPPADTLAVVETKKQTDVQVSTSEEIKKASEFSETHKSNRTSEDRLINQKIEVKEDAQSAVQRHDILQESIDQIEVQKQQKQDLLKQEDYKKSESDKIQHEESRKQFFEDLSRYQLGQEKLSKIFQKQSELSFIGKHANITA